MREVPGLYPVTREIVEHPTILYVLKKPMIHIFSKLSVLPREYELMTEAHAKLSVMRNCSRSSLYVCLGEGEQLAGGGRSAVAEVEAVGEAHSTQGERIWSSLVRQKVERGLLLLIPILWFSLTPPIVSRGSSLEGYFSLLPL